MDVIRFMFAVGVWLFAAMTSQWGAERGGGEGGGGCYAREVMGKAQTKKPGGYPTPRQESENIPEATNAKPSRVVKKLMTDYDGQAAPQGDRSTEVKLGIYILSFFSISEQTMDYSVSMYLRQAWRDPRLSFEPITTEKGKKITEIRLFEADWPSLWIPDTFFRNEKKAQFHKVTVRNRRLTVNATGHLWYAIRITGTFSCPMRLEQFPLDTQTCPMEFESFGYTMDTMYFGWVDNPVQHEEAMELPQFHLIEKTLHDCSQNYTAGSFPCAKIEFIIRRDIGYYIIQVFVPSILIVMLSWVSFWINIDGAPARVSLGLITVLTLTAQSASINEQMPKVSYIKAVDVWMIVCLIFVFCGLLEYAFVNVAARNGVRIKTLIVREAQPLPAAAFDLTYSHIRNDVPPPPEEPTSCFQAFYNCTHPGRLYTSTIDLEASKRRARNIDKFSRKTFPLTFLIFNIIYWVKFSLVTKKS